MSVTQTPQTTTVADESIGVRLPCPPGWEQIIWEANDEGFAPLVLAPQDWSAEDGFRPSLTVVGVEHGAQQRQVTDRIAGTHALAALIDAPDTHVISYDPGPGARAMRAVVQEGELGLVVLQWTFPRPGLTITVTGMVEVARYLTLAPVMEQIVTGIEFEDAAEPENPPDQAPGEVVEEPRQDEFLALHGEKLEDLSKVPAAQAHVPQGLSISRAALVALIAARRGRVKADRGDQDARAVLESLMQAGLADPDGRLTDDGRQVSRLVETADRSLMIEAAVGLLPLSFRAWSTRDWSVVACTDSPTQWWQQEPHGEVLSEVPQRVHLVYLPTSVLAMQIAQWVGLGPGWPFAIGADEIDRERFQERVQNPRVAPEEGFSPHLREVWRHPWITWTIRSEQPPLSMAFVNAGHRGHYALDPESPAEYERLAGTPSSFVWDALVELTLA